jgi:hypothetical protein
LETGNRKEKIGKRTPVKFAPLLFFEKFNRASNYKSDAVR